MSSTLVDFRVYCPLDAFEKAGEEHAMRIGGVVSTDQLDKQGEKIVQSGLDFGEFMGSGWFNDNHGQKTTDVLGYPTDVKLVRKGDRLPNGKAADANGWWAEGYLLDTDDGRKTFALCRSLAKSPRRLGFSIEGKVVKRSEADPDTILRACVRNVAVTHCPVNPGTEMVALAKALSAGHGSHGDPGSLDGGTPGDGRPLRRLAGTDAGLAVVDGLEDPVVVNLAPGADGGEPENGGIGGESVHKAADDDFGVGEIDDLAWADYWADELHAACNRVPAPTSLTKSEAEIVIRSRRPDLSSLAVDRIVAAALT